MNTSVMGYQVVQGRNKTLETIKPLLIKLSCFVTCREINIIICVDI